MMSGVNNSDDTALKQVAILDAGGQYAKLIDRRIRELSVHSEILPLDTPAEQLADFACLVISGGPQSVNSEDAPRYDPAVFETLGKPVLGICYGMQLMNVAMGGKVARKAEREDGQFEVVLMRNSPHGHVSELFVDLDSPLSASRSSVQLMDPANAEKDAEIVAQLDRRRAQSLSLSAGAHGDDEDAKLPEVTETVLLTHGDSVTEVAPGFRVSCQTRSGIVSGIKCVEKKMYGVQFHPEVDLTINGFQMISNFLFRIARCKPSYTMKSRRETAINEIRSIVGDDSKVLVLVSGGVDSAVCAALLQQALRSDQLICVHVDHGFMRQDESDSVAIALKNVGIDLHTIKAEDAFRNATTTIDGKETEPLKDTVRPEVKRKIIGDTFMRESEKYVRSIGLKSADVFLAQGTLRPDLIESASSLASNSGNADVIKTHHNDTALVRELRQLGRVIEPLRDYHKDEVRVLGSELGLPNEIVWRQPFPGPGLAIRIVCAHKPYATDDDADIVAKLAKFATDDVHVSLLPCRTVGVQGDQRSYSHLVALSSVHSKKLLTPVEPPVLDKEAVINSYKGYACPCCGAGTRDAKEYGTFHVCQVCGWEDDRQQAEDETLEGGANNVSLRQARLNYKRCGNCDGIEKSDDADAKAGDDAPDNASKHWHTMFELARDIPKRVHGVNRVIYAFGEPLPTGKLTEITPTTLSPENVRKLQRADAIVNETLAKYDLLQHLSQVPVVLFPVTFGDGAVGQHGICIRAFCSHDFMVGVPAVPGKQMPIEALAEMVGRIRETMPGVSRVCYDLTSKPPATTEWE